MFCPEGNIPLSVFRDKHINTFMEALNNNYTIIDDESAADNENLDDFEQRIELTTFESCLEKFEILTATSPSDGSSLQIDTRILENSKFLFTDNIIKNVQGNFIFVHPTTFIISLAAWDNYFHELINRCKEKVTTDYFNDIEFFAENIKQFEGWSLSIPIEVSNIAIENIPTSYPFAKKIEKRGRRSLSKAREYWQYKLKFDKGSKSNEQIRREIQRKTGEAPSDKSLRDWKKSPLSPRD